MNFNYQGITTLSYGHNGVNTVGWGDISQTGCTGSGVAACTRVEASSGTITEADTRMDASGTWSNVGASNAADVQSVMAHESGHAIGFGHVTDSSEVMYTPIFLGDTSDRKLGMGDADEDNLKY
jgi:predicted Zn-dependent protease